MGFRTFHFPREAWSRNFSSSMILIHRQELAKTDLTREKVNITETKWGGEEIGRGGIKSKDGGFTTGKKRLSQKTEVVRVTMFILSF